MKDLQQSLALMEAEQQSAGVAGAAAQPPAQEASPEASGSGSGRRPAVGLPRLNLDDIPMPSLFADEPQASGDEAAEDAGPLTVGLDSLMSPRRASGSSSEGTTTQGGGSDSLHSTLRVSHFDQLPLGSAIEVRRLGPLRAALHTPSAAPPPPASYSLRWPST